METFPETRKRKHKDDNSGSKRKYGSKSITYLKNRAEQESYFKQLEELAPQARTTTEFMLTTNDAATTVNVSNV